MDIPFFYAPGITGSDRRYTLDEDAAKHAVQVLRKRPGDAVMLTDGKGGLFEAVVEETGKKHGSVVISKMTRIPAPAPKTGIGISFTKSMSRTEWFLEKATEIGITDIYPLQCRRTERTRYNIARLHKLLIAAMLQSQQAYLPALHEQATLAELAADRGYRQKFVAHCENDEKPFLGEVVSGDDDALVLIGPEGDFTPEEILLAKNNGFLPVSLGRTRLRTETAGVVACTLMQAAKARQKT